MKLIKKKTLIIIISIVCFLQFILIAHRLSFNTDLLFNFYKKDYGMVESLKINKGFASVINIKRLSKKNNIKNFQLSEKLQSPFFYSRIIESSYPIKVNQNSKYYFAFKNEIVKNCLLLENFGEINLYECRK
jgi:hypothetical protein